MVQALSKCHSTIARFEFLQFDLDDVVKQCKKAVIQQDGQYGTADSGEVAQFLTPDIAIFVHILPRRSSKVGPTDQLQL